MSVRLRRLPNGILTAPKRGRPPPIPDGYEIYNNDPFIFALILPKCPHRICLIIARKFQSPSEPASILESKSPTLS